MSDSPSQPPSPLARWLQRRSTARARRVWGILFILGWAGWCWLVHDWAGAHGHRDWVDGVRPLYVLVASAVYWPPVIVLWRGLYPAHPLALPWDDTGQAWDDGDR